MSKRRFVLFIFLGLKISAGVAQQDPYKILDIKQGCSLAEVKEVYRRLAKQFHPDLRPGDHAAEERLKEVNFAYASIVKDILSAADGKDELSEVLSKIKPYPLGLARLRISLQAAKQIHALIEDLEGSMRAHHFDQCEQIMAALQALGLQSLEFAAMAFLRTYVPQSELAQPQQKFLSKWLSSNPEFQSNLLWGYMDQTTVIHGLIGQAPAAQLAKIVLPVLHELRNAEPDVNSNHVMKKILSRLLVHPNDLRLHYYLELSKEPLRTIFFVHLVSAYIQHPNQPDLQFMFTSLESQFQPFSYLVVFPFVAALANNGWTLESIRPVLQSARGDDIIWSDLKNLRQILGETRLLDFLKELISNIGTSNTQKLRNEILNARVWQNQEAVWREGLVKKIDEQFAQETVCESVLR